MASKNNTKKITRLNEQNKAKMYYSNNNMIKQNKAKKANRDQNKPKGKAMLKLNQTTITDQNKKN